ncbi:hypothetical protein WK41_21900 [Burkholderia cepacia]|nr:hypothetical protein WK41_21900 [Burkholderia cepacia]
MALFAGGRSVWKSYQRLQTDTENLGNSKDLLEDARRALDIARGRYKAGVGTFTELLNAQAALNDARKQRVLAVSKWRTARLKLAESLGKLGLWGQNLKTSLVIRSRHSPPIRQSDGKE